MGIARYYTVGAVVPDIGSLKELTSRIDALDFTRDSVVVLTRRRDESLARILLPEARVRSVESGLSRREGVGRVYEHLLLGLDRILSHGRRPPVDRPRRAGGAYRRHRGRPRRLSSTSPRREEAFASRDAQAPRRKVGGFLPRRLRTSPRHRTRRRLRRGPGCVSRRRGPPVSPRRRSAARALIRGISLGAGT